jgi:BirA family biotin operon repressor/biotin-[acetyl-CoA-carboxylase] ligase
MMSGGRFSGKPKSQKFCAKHLVRIRQSMVASTRAPIGKRPMPNLPPPFTLHFKEETGSTNDDAMNLARDGAPDFTVVWALRQTKGRGRFNRQWKSGGGNLHWTCLLRVENGRPPLESLAVVSALAVGDVVRNAVPKDRPVLYKWPNDVMIGDSKVSGTLIEGGLDYGWLVLGIGINLAWTPEVTDAQYSATCLHEVGATITLDELGIALAKSVHQRVAQWRHAGFDGEAHKEYSRFLWRKDQEIRVSFDAAKMEGVTGISLGVDEKGALLVRLADGSTQTISAGEVKAFGEAR